MSATWTPEKYDRCPRCRGELLGRIVGPKVTHKLRCDSCGWSGDTDTLRRIADRQHKALAANPDVQRALAKLPPTRFVGYDVLECDTEVVGIIRKRKETDR